MKLLQMYRHERALALFAICKAGINPDDIVLRARLRNAGWHLRRACKAYYRFLVYGLVDITKPGDVFRSYKKVAE